MNIYIHLISDEQWNRYCPHRWDFLRICLCVGLLSLRHLPKRSSGWVPLRLMSSISLHRWECHELATCTHARNAMRDVSQTQMTQCALEVGVCLPLHRARGQRQACFASETHQPSGNILQTSQYCPNQTSHWHSTPAQRKNIQKLKNECS